jgi:hypothetical protein
MDDNLLIPVGWGFLNHPGIGRYPVQSVVISISRSGVGLFIKPPSINLNTY